MSTPIARRVENAFVAALREQLDLLGYTETMLPAYAGHNRAGGGSPYCVAAAFDLEETTHQSGVFKCEIRVVLVSNLDDSTSDEHDARLAAVESAINALPKLGRDYNNGVRLFGFYIDSQTTATEDQSFGDVFVIQAGVGRV